MADGKEKLLTKRRVNLYIGIAILLALAGFSYALYPGSSDKPLDSRVNVSYTSGSYGISFLYPPGYKLTERNLPHPVDTEATGTLDHEVILRKVGVDVPKESDASPSIVIQMFENEPEYMTAGDFVQYVDPNRSRATGDVASTTYGGYSGLEYTWTGLFEGRSFIVARKGFIYVFSAIGANEEPMLDSDWRKIMDSLSLSQ